MAILQLLQPLMGKYIKNINKTEIVRGQNVIIGVEQWLKTDVVLLVLQHLQVGYGMNYTPEDLRKKYAPTKKDHLAGDDISYELQSYFNIDNSNFRYAESYFTKDYMFKWLKNDKPILICVWNKPNAKWTTASHYMLLLATDNISKVYVSNPNGEKDGTRASRLV